MDTMDSIPLDIIVDLDGTIADCSHRIGFIRTKPKNYDAFYAGVYHDGVHHDVLEVIRAYKLVHRARVIITTGRPRKCYDDSVRWLYDKASLGWEAIYMRPDNDYRPDDIIKRELLDQMRADGYNPKLAFDDRDRVVKMWRENGIRCLQVSSGDF